MKFDLACNQSANYMSTVAHRTAPCQSRRGALVGRLERQPSTRGFTLIEIMVVVIIIGLLAAVIVPQFMGRVDDARIAKAKQDIQSLQTALTLYKLDNFNYPTAEEGLQLRWCRSPTIRTRKTGARADTCSTCPKIRGGHEYQYQIPPMAGAITICIRLPGKQCTGSRLIAGAAVTDGDKSVTGNRNLDNQPVGPAAA